MKSYKAKDYKYENKNNEIVFQRFMLINGIGTNFHYYIIGRLLSNKTKIDRLLSMDNNKCYEIEDGKSNSIAIISKNKELHIKSLDSEDFNIFFIIENVTLDQLAMLGATFESSEIIKTVNSYMKIMPDHQMISNNKKGTQIYVKREDNIITISGLRF